MAQEHDYHFKVLMVGDAGVGKSSMIRGITDGFPPPENIISNIGIDFSVRSFEVDDKVAKLQIWDTAGQERFRSITRAYYRGCSGIFLVYDIMYDDTFSRLFSCWLNEVKEGAPQNVQVIVLGNKCDLLERRQVSTERGRAFAEEHGLKFLETNVKTGENVEKAFLMLTRDMINTSDMLQMNKDLPTSYATESNTPSCSCSVV